MSNFQDIDPHQEGDLSSMAPAGTTMPNDAGKMNVLPSVPRPDEGFDSKEEVIDVNAAQRQGRDIPRSYRDISATGEVETGTG